MRFAAILAFALAAVCGHAPAADELVIGSKRFTESYILGEIVRLAVEGTAAAVHKPGLGNTGIVFAALKAGSIDLYPEYTGTIAREILGMEAVPSIDELNRALARQSLGVAVPLGFNNGYALGMREDLAARLGIRRISELARHPQLKFGLSQEFINRADGWPGLARKYALAHAPLGLDHGLAYEAIAAGKIEVMDLYTTDAKIGRYGLRVLEDDRGYFPRYDALLIYRLDVPARHPQAWRALQGLAGRIDEQRMMRLNAAAEIEGRSFAQAASEFFKETDSAAPRARRGLMAVMFADDFGRLTREHLVLVFASLAAAIVLGVPLGVAAAKIKMCAQPILGAVGVIQTIPSLALLAFLITLLGTIGTLPALAALFLYALLPIVRNTYTGLAGIGPGMRQAALALGFSAPDRLRLIELPLAMPSVLAGVKISAVINVGTATIAAFIGAGGYGERIAAGLALNDNTMLLAGALPAAALAILVQALFEIGERAFGRRWRAGLSSP
ncbi:MAG: ABC transporter permease subunit [Betaproteobacteria bacterium]|nr:ABC transporter permease subunit [Betaproteobacteria bacterium]